MFLQRRAGVNMERIMALSPRQAIYREMLHWSFRSRERQSAIPAAIVRMKTYACLNCGRGLESGEFATPSDRGSLYPRCPACGSPISASGTVFMVAGVLWALICFLFPGGEAEFAALVGGGALAALGATRLMGQFRAGRRWKCDRASSP